MPNVDVKQAVKAATEFLSDVIQDSRSRSALLEEVELSEDGSEWFVTISVPAPSSNSLAAAMSALQVDPRDYRIIRVNAVNGLVSSMKIRKL